MMKHVCNLSTETKVTPVDDKMIQPNAVDLRVKRVFRPEAGIFALDGDRKEHLPRREIAPISRLDGSKHFALTPGYYVVEFEQTVEMGEHEAGLVVSRSTLMRNGVWMTSCLYDAGYKGPMVSGLSVPLGVSFRFPVGERLAQFLVFDAESVKLYNGTYQAKP